MSDREYCLELPPVYALPIRADARWFPVRRIYCVGRNYAEHVREMGGDSLQDPVFFQKPRDALVASGASLRYPQATGDLHHEVELVVALHGSGMDWSLQEAEAAVFGYAVGCDLTRRDLQHQAKLGGKPWDIAKAFDESAPVSELLPVSLVGHPRAGRIWLDVDGQRRQDADLSEMLWSVPQLLARLSQLFELRPGDLVFTGTPAGVGALQRGQTVRAGIEGLAELNFEIES